MFFITQDFVDEVEMDGIQVHPEYGGRGMYGKTCFAIVGRIDDLVSFLLNHVAMLNDTTAEWGSTEWQQLRIDDMGHEMVYYWPQIQVAAPAGSNI